MLDAVTQRHTQRNFNMQQTDRTLQEYETSLAPAEVLSAAKAFFARSLNIYSAFLEKEGPTFAAFRAQVVSRFESGEHLAPA